MHGDACQLHTRSACRCTVELMKKVAPCAGPWAHEVEHPAASVQGSRIRRCSGAGGAYEHAAKRASVSLQAMQSLTTERHMLEQPSLAPVNEQLAGCSQYTAMQFAADTGAPAFVFRPAPSTGKQAVQGLARPGARSTARRTQRALWWLATCVACCSGRLGAVRGPSTLASCESVHPLRPMQVAEQSSNWPGQSDAAKRLCSQHSGGARAKR